MRAERIVIALCVGLWMVCGAGVTRGEVEIEWVRVGDPGNEGEWSGSGHGGWGMARFCGAVDYEYRIGKYEVTNAQYCAFLNAVASVDDPNQLFAHLAVAPEHDTIGIYRSGTVGDYTYTLRPGRENHPVTWVSFFSAARFANWLHNGQPVGLQDETTTEDGAYDLSLGTDVVRKPGAQVFLPSEDEWYKAAFYDAARQEYWLYATQTDDEPTFEAPPGTDLARGSANHGLYGIVVPSTNTVPVGSYTYKPTVGPYGTYDQMGNVAEWTESLMHPELTARNTRGGGYSSIYIEWSWSISRVGAEPIYFYPSMGIRLASLVDEGVCGDGELNYGEFCDDDNQVSGDGCSADCVIEFCGDEILQLGIGETCDDGNRVDGDGCDSECQREYWYCGDRFVREDHGETCDDGNTIDGDGCSASCQTELCYQVDCTHINRQCTYGHCDPSDGVCYAAHVVDGTVCNAGGGAGSGTCVSGVCEGESSRCTADSDCVVTNNDVCSWDQCNATSGRCEPPIPVMFGDVCGETSDLPPNGLVNMSDLLCALDAFGPLDFHRCPNADVFAFAVDECPGGNGMVDLADVLAILAAVGAPTSPKASLVCECPANPAADLISLDWRILGN